MRLGKCIGRRILATSLAGIYSEYKQHFFPKLLENPNIPPEDKEKIRELLKKPWNPYIRRHSALTEKSKMLKEHVLRQHAIINAYIISFLTFRVVGTDEQ